MKAIFKYRPEIDGLRTVAVLLVIFFHAKLDFFKGGFVGVDIFFVISGYLITSIIYKEKINQNFSFISFYDRRIRRIFPMIFFLLLITSIVSFFVYSPNELKNFSQSIVSSVTYTSNIYFFNKTGYFSGNLNTSPLIHTWSLAVEEQFYIFFPLILSLIISFKEKIIKFIIISLAFASFISIFFFVNVEDFNFFMASSRVWELLAGSFLALNRKRLLAKLNNKTSSNLFSLAGFIMILWSAVYFDKSTFHPGFITIVPVLGTLLVIEFSDKHNFLGKILSNNFIVHLGLLSYSAYLIHQPLFVFVEEIYKTDLSVSVYIFLTILTFVFSHFTYIYIESPFRNKNVYSRKFIFKSGFSISMIFISIGLFGHFSKGFPNRYSENQFKIFNEIEISPLRNDCHTEGINYLKPQNACNSSSLPTKWAVLGDSHGVEISYQLSKNLEIFNESALQLTFSGCPPAYGYNSSNPGCSDWTKESIQYLINNENIKNVVLVYRHSFYLKGENSREDLGTKLNPIEFIKNGKEISSKDKMKIYFDGYLKIIEELLLNNKNIYLIYPIPEIIKPIDKYIFNNIVFNKERIITEGPTLEYYNYRNNYVLDFNNKTNHKNLLKIPVKELFSNETTIKVIKEGKALFFDNNHVNLQGANIITNKIINLYNERLQKTFN